VRGMAWHQPCRAAARGPPAWSPPPRRCGILLSRLSAESAVNRPFPLHQCSNSTENFVDSILSHLPAVAAAYQAHRLLWHTRPFRWVGPAGIGFHCASRLALRLSPADAAWAIGCCDIE
jgi:hypothetical protein